MSAQSTFLLILQFICLLYFALFTGIIVKGPWLMVQAAAALLCIWAILIMKPGRFNAQPEVKENAVLISRGPYRIIRNPMYLGLTVFFAGTVIAEPGTLNILILILMIIVFLLKIYSEEKYLALKFGRNYEIYKEKTYRLIPFLF